MILEKIISETKQEKNTYSTNVCHCCEKSNWMNISKILCECINVTMWFCFNTEKKLYIIQVQYGRQSIAIRIGCVRHMHAAV